MSRGLSFICLFPPSGQKLYRLSMLILRSQIPAFSGSDPPQLICILISV